MQNRCEKCVCHKLKDTAPCDECGSIMDVNISGSCYSIKCRKCENGIATTIYRLCFYDNDKYPKEYYYNLSDCPYANNKLK